MIIQFWEMQSEKRSRGENGDESSEVIAKLHSGKALA
jgi:hypothetical protein